MSCAFLPCADVETCALPGGCIRTPHRQRAPLGKAPTILYNPMTGTRRDLEVNTEENGAAAEERWRKARARYERTLDTSD